MSRETKIREYKCDGGCSYGSCDKVNQVSFMIDRTTDFYRIVHTHHIGEEDEHRMEVHGKDDFMEHLMELLNEE